MCVDLGGPRFIHNNISSLELSSKVEIGNACFNDNDLALEEAFFVKENELISYGGNIKGNVLIPDVVSIGKKAFFETYIVSVTLPDTVTTIEDEAFKSNYLVEIYLSDKINFVSETAFSDNIYLSEIIINNNSSNLLNYPWGAISSNLYWLK